MIVTGLGWSNEQSYRILSSVLRVSSASATASKYLNQLGIWEAEIKGAGGGLSPLCCDIVNVALPFACIVSLQDLPSNIVKT